MCLIDLLLSNLFSILTSFMESRERALLTSDKRRIFFGFFGGFFGVSFILKTLTKDNGLDGV
jgi:hypothetical protein